MMKQLILKIFYTFLLLFSMSVYADKAHYLRMDVENKSAITLEYVYSSYGPRSDKGYNPKVPIKPGKTGLLKSKGWIARGNYFAFVYRINKDLYLDIFMSLYQNNYLIYEYCFSNKQRKFINDDNGFGDGGAAIVCDTGNSHSLLSHKFNISHHEYSFSGVIEGQNTGAFKLYRGYSFPAKFEGPDCSTKPKAKLGVKVSTDTLVTRNDGVFAMIASCPYFSYCPPNTELCKSKTVNGIYTGDFYWIPFSDQTLYLLRDKTYANVTLWGNINEYDKLPMNTSIRLGKPNIKVGSIVTGDKLYDLLTEVNKSYCDASKKQNKDVICGEPKYTLQKRTSGEIKYLPAAELKNYDCYVDSVTYPNIGSNVCTLRGVKYK